MRKETIMGLRRNLTTATVVLDGWDLDIIRRECDERLNEIAEAHVRVMEQFGRDVGEYTVLWDWYWDLASKVHDADRQIAKEIADR